MSFEIDTFAVLRAIGGRAELFTDLRKDLAKSVPALVEKQLKAIGSDVERLKQVHEALGAGPFFAVVQSLGPSKAVALLKKLDKHHPSLKAKSSDWAVPHLVALAKGERSVADAPVKASTASAKASKPAKAPTNAELVRNLDAKAMGAKRKRA